MANSITETNVLRRTEGHVSAELEGLVVLLSVETGNYYNLNGVGSDIWRQVDGQRTVKDICDLITATYEVDPSEALAAIQEFAQDLCEKKLLDVA